jgi:hypothetical protein
MGIHVTKSIRIDKKRNFERGVMRPESDAMLLGIVASGLIGEIQGHCRQPPLRQAVVPLQRAQTRSPDQALSNTDLQLRHKRGSRFIVSLLGFV